MLVKTNVWFPESVGEGPMAETGARSRHPLDLQPNLSIAVPANAAASEPLP